MNTRLLYAAIFFIAIETGIIVALLSMILTELKKRN
jgi:hypothetical protein